MSHCKGKEFESRKQSAVASSLKPLTETDITELENLFLGA